MMSDRFRARAPRRRKASAFLSSLALLAAVASAELAPGVNLPPPDSEGWIKLFRGVQDTGNFYRFISSTRNVPAQNKQPLVGGPFSIVGADTIRSAGTPAGHFLFKQALSHYRVSFRMRWPGNVGNAGLLMKVQENDTAQSQGFPRSVECQGDPQQGIGQIWALGSIREGNSMQNGGTWVTFRGRMITHPSSWAAGSCPNISPVQAAIFDSTQPEIHWGGGGDPCRNLIVGAYGFQQPRPPQLRNQAGTGWGSNTGWVTVEVETHGHDTTRHYVDGQLVMVYHSPRIAPRTKQDSVIKYLTSGQMAWQSEGSNVYYHDIKVKLFPQDPLYEMFYPSSLRGPAPVARRTARARVVFERGFPVAMTSEGRLRSLDGRIRRVE